MFGSVKFAVNSRTIQRFRGLRSTVSSLKDLDLSSGVVRLKLFEEFHDADMECLYIGKANKTCISCFDVINLIDGQAVFT